MLCRGAKRPAPLLPKLRGQFAEFLHWGCFHRLSALRACSPVSVWGTVCSPTSVSWSEARAKVPFPRRPPPTPHPSRWAFPLGLATQWRFRWVLQPSGVSPRPSAFARAGGTDSLCADSRGAETLEPSAIPDLTGLVVTHVSMLTSDTSSGPRDPPSSAHGTFRYRSARGEIAFGRARRFGAPMEPRYILGGRALDQCALTRSSEDGCFQAHLLAVFGRAPPFPLVGGLGTLAGDPGCFPFDLRSSHRRSVCSGDWRRHWKVVGAKALPYPNRALPPVQCTRTRYLHSFRGKPAISEFDWPFTPNPRSSPPFATEVGAVLQEVVPPLRPAQDSSTRFRVPPAQPCALERLGLPAPTPTG